MQGVGLAPEHAGNDRIDFRADTREHVWKSTLMVVSNEVQSGNGGPVWRQRGIFSKNDMHEYGECSRPVPLTF